MSEWKEAKIISIPQESVLNLCIFDCDLSGSISRSGKARLSKMAKTPAFADGQIAGIAFCHDLVLADQKC